MSSVERTAVTSEFDEKRLNIGHPSEALSALVAHSADCVKLIDLDGRIRGWNRACEIQYGWDAADALGAELPHVPAEMRRRAIADIRGVAARGEIVEREMEAMRSDGSRFFADVVVIPVLDEDGDASGVLSVVREAVSDSRLDHQRESFAALLAQHLRAPLSEVLLSAQLLARNEIMQDMRLRGDAAKHLARSASRALRFIEDLILLSEIESGKLALVKEPTEFGPILTEALTTVEDAAGRVVVDYDPLLGTIPLDSRRVFAALVVLLDAALRVTPPTASVTVSVFRARSRAVVEVRDRGQSLTAAEASALLSRYYTGTDPRGQVGSGMGMYVVRGIVEAHGGDIAISAAERGSGSVVRLRFPT